MRVVVGLPLGLPAGAASIRPARALPFSGHGFRRLRSTRRPALAPPPSAPPPSTVAARAEPLSAARVDGGGGGGRARVDGGGSGAPHAWWLGTGKLEWLDQRMGLGV